MFRASICILFLSRLLIPELQAKCGMHAITVWPQASNIQKNSILIIEGYASSQTVIKGLNKEFAIYLQSQKERVPLKVLKINSSSFHLSQAILKPERELVPGALYTLHIDSLPDDEKFGFERHNFKWTVLDQSDTASPVWIRKPEHIGNIAIPLGCGPERYAGFSACISDASEVIVKARVRNLKNSEIEEYWLQPRQNIIKVGHDMCGGEFSLADTDYEVSFTLIDASLNVGTESTAWLKFHSPGDGYGVKGAEKFEAVNCYDPVKEEQNAFVIFIGIGIFLAGLYYCVMQKSPGKRRVRLRN